MQPNRLQELHRQFSELADQIPEGATKRAISLLHAMMQESMRAGSAVQGGADDAQTVARWQQLLDYHRMAQAMEGAAQATGLPVGHSAPDFALPDTNGNTVRLSDFRGQPVVLVFYPLDWSPACSDQLSLYQMELDEFERRGAQLLAVSVDSLYSHGAWAMLRGLQFPLLADFQPRGEVAQRYGVYRPADGFSERALFIVDGEGVIRYAHVSPQLHQIPDIYELYEALDAIVETHPTTSRGETTEKEVMPV